MAKPLSELLKQVRPELIKAAQVRAEREIIEFRLMQLREHLALSQQDLAQLLGISQPSVANLERRGTEVKLSTLKRYVEAMGGKLSLNIELPDGKHLGFNC